MDYDVIVVGGGFAGLSAAMQLARARRRVLLADVGAPRNRFSPASHGFFGHDGKPPETLQAEARAQVLAYPNVTHRASEAMDGRAVDQGFELDFADGGSVRARKLVLAGGLRDEVEAVPGMTERWGVSVLHCPYCHGYEIDGAPIGVIARNEMAAHQATILPDWGPTTLFTQGEHEPDAAQREHLDARGVTIERTPVVELLGDAPSLDGVRLADGRVLPVRALFTAPRTELASPLAQALGCELIDGPQGLMIKLDEHKQTTVPGVYAAGDAANPMHNATLASASGVLAGIGAHRSLMGF